ncbi:MAG: hypothetical protein MH204_08590 [Fimbriimonadaceae bacterium]|nr:hypothetical protein [Fimbriimonadaceae bacterium]
MARVVDRRISKKHAELVEIISSGWHRAPIDGLDVIIVKEESVSGGGWTEVFVVTDLFQNIPKQERDRILDAAIDRVLLGYWGDEREPFDEKNPADRKQLQKIFSEQFPNCRFILGLTVQEARNLDVHGYESDVE